MGTDIHIRIQKREGEGEWETLVPPVQSWKDGDFTNCYRSWYSERNYDVFAVLADVRNGYGFAGVYRGEPLKFISEPRGLPDGVSEESEWERYDNDGNELPFTDPEGVEGVRYIRDSLGDHSFTWFLAWELLGANEWNQKQYKGGVVTPREFKRWRDDGAPQSWSGDITGPQIVVVDEHTMDGLINLKVVDPTKDDGRITDEHSCRGTDGNRYYARIEWQQPGGVNESCSDFIEWMDKELKPLADKYGGENVRVIMGFDS